MNEREVMIGRLMGIMRDAGDQSSNEDLYNSMSAMLDDENTHFLDVYPRALHNRQDPEQSIGLVAITNAVNQGRCVHLIRLFYVDDRYKRSWCGERTVEEEMRRSPNDDWGYVVCACDQDARVRLANLFFINGFVSIPCRSLAKGYITTCWRRRALMDDEQQSA